MSTPLSLILAVSLVPISAGAASLKKPEVELKIDAMLKQMTLEEKFGQLQQQIGRASCRERV